MRARLEALARARAADAGAGAPDLLTAEVVARRRAGEAVAAIARAVGPGGVLPVRPGSRAPAPRLAALSSVGDAPRRLPRPPRDASPRPCGPGETPWHRTPLPDPARPTRHLLRERQLHRRSLDAFGYGPRTPGRILRLRRAPAPARGGLPYADFACVAGYADQAHLARETLRAYAAGADGAKSETPQPSGSRTTA
ncbi:hypothetical protein OG594_33675 [Streptomyces sp. NBC_01214]|uniref:hypothetical protein n=1 Tax=Streptomyces sp. NBC_01214 TaxID=2903777 RepID=UPI0022540B3D|nr:hypothetical protein [Streptomyces sp. NBC_01214]MCX4806514.1 hypothetical protein [Streptomyces sp. NBC_01214]